MSVQEWLELLDDADVMSTPGHYREAVWAFMYVLYSVVGGSQHFPRQQLSTDRDQHTNTALGLHLPAIRNSSRATK